MKWFWLNYILQLGSRNWCCESKDNFYCKNNYILLGANLEVVESRSSNRTKRLELVLWVVGHFGCGCFGDTDRAEIDIFRFLKHLCELKMGCGHMWMEIRRILMFKSESNCGQLRENHWTIFKFLSDYLWPLIMFYRF